MIRPILRMGNPQLRAKNLEVDHTFLKSTEFQTLIVDMKDSMNHYGGIGLAAPQIGVNLKIAIIDLSPDNERYPSMGNFPFTIFVNPKISVVKNELQGFWEGCLSIPGLKGYVERPSSIKINYLDETGNEKIMEASGFLATVIQHELDHLDGVLYIDKIRDTTKLTFQEEYQKYWTSN